MSSRSYTVPSRAGRKTQSTPGKLGEASNLMKAKSKKAPIPTLNAFGASPEYMAKQLGIKKVKSSTSTVTPSQSASKKRKISDAEGDNYDDDEEEVEARAQDALAGIEDKPKRARKKKGEEPEEKRLRRHRAKAPGTYLERLGRVRTQRMFLIDRNRTMSADGTHEEEELDIAGSTGNVYKVTVGKIPDCTCPDAVKGNQCKHIIYVSSMFLIIILSQILINFTGHGQRP